jgi:hypothetical protein
MSFQNHIQLSADHPDSDFRNCFADAFSLRIFLSQSLVAPDYKPQDSMADAVSLSSEGESWVKRLRESFPDMTEGEAKLAVFIVFSHHELFVDVHKTNVLALEADLNAEILGGNIIFPWVYGKLLYDRYFDMWPDQLKELPFDETVKLLQDTPPGVFQLRSFLIGPFGVLQSGTCRYLPPKRTVPLWHCSDPSCNSLHTVRLSSGRCRIAEGVTFIDRELNQLDEQPSEWSGFYGDFDGSPDWYDHLHLEDLPWLLANGFSASELNAILRAVIETGSKVFRSRLPVGKRFKALLSGSAVDICSRLDQSQSMQLLLLASDKEIAVAIETLLENGTIRIPWTEVRSAMVSPRPSGWFGLRSECSQHGVRSRSTRSEVPLARLKELIRQAYGTADDLAQLEWFLRHTDGDSVHEKLNRYIHTESPVRVTRDLLLANPKFLKKAYDFLRHGVFPFPVAPHDEERVITKILWKLGFDTPNYPPHQSAFWQRLEQLLSVTRTYKDYTEADREAIRSVAVNFFVSVEELLDLSLSFICWTLLGDHYGKTKFRWNTVDARSLMAERLDGRSRGGNEPVRYDSAGRNTLYPLIQGFALLADLCEELIKDDPADVHRAKGDIPTYADRTELDLFPFEHTALILDVRQRDRERMLELLRDTTKAFESPDMCEIRNRLEHKRPDFPTQSEIEQTCMSISEALRKMELSGICPLVYFMTSIRSDSFGREVMSLCDYQGRNYDLHQPSQYKLVRLPSGRQPVVLIPWLHVGESLDVVRFSIHEPSEFTEMWKEYPKRRSRLVDGKTSNEDQPTNASTTTNEPAAGVSI